MQLNAPGPPAGAVRPTANYLTLRPSPGRGSNGQRAAKPELCLCVGPTRPRQYSAEAPCYCRTANCIVQGPYVRPYSVLHLELLARPASLSLPRHAAGNRSPSRPVVSRRFAREKRRAVTRRVAAALLA
ncbi:hypothetical protein VTO73DRAFT_15444 [Trametes versicolor]